MAKLLDYSEIEMATKRLHREHKEEQQKKNANFTILAGGPNVVNMPLAGEDDDKKDGDPSQINSFGNAYKRQRKQDDSSEDQN